MDNIGKLLFTFDGRIGRQNFWIGWLILFAAGFVLSFIPLINMLAFVILIYPKVCIYTKRLHDMGKSGWLQLIPYGLWISALILGFVLFGAGIISAALASRAADDDAAAIMPMLASMGGFFAIMSVAGLVNLAFWLWVGCTPSQPGGNRYGAGPDGALDQDVF